MPPTEAIDDLRGKLAHADAVIAELRGVVADLRRQIDAQQAHIHRLVKMTFGRSSERAAGPTLFDGLDPEPDPTPAIVVEPTLEAETVAPKRKSHGRRTKPKDLARRPELIDLTEAEKVCACCGTVKVRIGQTVNERLDYQPMSIFVRELIRPVYACRSCESQGDDPQIAKAVRPPEPIPKSNVEAGLLAHVIVSKFCDHLPLNRQEAILARHSWDVRRSTLCDHLQKCGLLLRPLYDRMRRRLLQSFAIHADDTPLVLLRPRRTAFAWVYLGDAANPYTLFDLTPGRSQTYPQAFLAGYKGFVHADAYDGYNPVHGNVRHLGCWMHARRYFVEAEPTDARAVEALAFIRTLYAVEKELKDEQERTGERSRMTRRCGRDIREPDRSWSGLPNGSNSRADPLRRRACSVRPSGTSGISGRPWFDTWTTPGSPSTTGRRSGPFARSPSAGPTGSRSAAMAACRPRPSC
jgi:transposase/uncharacterized coiled-coil protein SlyX